MNTAKVMDDCTKFACSMAPYVDGELDAGHAVDMEEHVIACASCADRVALLRAMRVSLKRACTMPAPDALRARMAATIAVEQRRIADAADVQRPMEPKLIRLRYAVALAAAAGVVFAMNVARHRTPVAQVGAAPVQRAAVDIDALLEDLVALHANPIEPEMTNPEDLQRFDPVVGVPVRRPPFQPFGANFRGARVNAWADHRAALLQYTVSGGHRVTVYVFDTRAIHMNGTRLESRVVRERPVYVGNVRGYSIAAGERSGVGYALASDLDTDQNAKMALAALQ